MNLNIPILVATLVTLVGTTAFGAPTPDYSSEDIKEPTYSRSQASSTVCELVSSNLDAIMHEVDKGAPDEYVQAWLKYFIAPVMNKAITDNAVLMSFWANIRQFTIVVRTSDIDPSSFSDQFLEDCLNAAKGEGV